ncbi:MAG: Eco47II family restriction endonuclease [Aeriscardovia sp.]|nr:Eco47II family restriction endonuclease [Aeriscardovia sp.]
MQQYNLGFISDALIYRHVKKTVLLYKTFIDLKEFNSNLIDPIKLTFDAKVYGKSFEDIIESECVRQIDKANTNHIGYFHQNLFNYAGNGWRVPVKVFDVVNDERKIYVEMKNKHNTMNSSSAQATYMKMQQQLINDPESTCMLVEAIAKKSQNIVWEAKLNGVQYRNEHIRRVSMDKFYEIVFGDKNAFMKLCKALPIILDDVIAETHKGTVNNTVYRELRGISSDTFKSLYLLAFETYEGFSNL